MGNAAAMQEGQAVRQRPPLAEVRKTLRVKWYRSPIDPTLLRQLMRRSDLKAWLQTLGVLCYMGVTAVVAWYLFSQQQWLGFAIALFAHGTFGCFLGAAGHELDHGTVFKTRWLNRFFLNLFGLIIWFNHRDYALSHTYHHRYTLHPDGDREVLLPQSPVLRALYIVQMFTINVTGGPAARGIIGRVGDTLRTAAGKLPNRDSLGEPIDNPAREWLAALYEAHPEERRKSIRWARLTLLFHAVVIAVAIVFHLWLLPVFITLSKFLANWWQSLTNLPMHAGLRDNVADFRKCTRTIKLDPFSSMMYWHMNWHIEHHMYAGVPCYNLRRLNKAIAADLPEPKGVLGAWREMRATWRRQQIDPSYQFEIPVPAATASGRVAKEDDLSSSIGDLAPGVLAKG